jgi:hypothetical protein
MILDRTMKEIKKGQTIAFTLPSDMQDGIISNVEAVSVLDGRTGQAFNKLFIELCIKLPAIPGVAHTVLQNIAILRDPESSEHNPTRH